MQHRPSFIPTLDISNGQAVLVKHGQVYKILGDPMEKAKFISIGTHFQIVDIDAAMGIGSNKDLTPIMPLFSQKIEQISDGEVFGV